MLEYSKPWGLSLKASIVLKIICTTHFYPVPYEEAGEITLQTVLPGSLSQRTHSESRSMSPSTLFCGVAQHSCHQGLILVLLRRYATETCPFTGP